MNKTSSLRRKILALLLITFLLGGVYFNVSSDKQELSFLQVYGGVNYESESPINLTVACISNNETTIEENDVRVAFKEDSIDVNNIKFEQAAKTLRYSLWYLTFDLNISSDIDSIVVTDIIFNEKTYPIGQLSFNKVDDVNLWKNEQLDLKSHAVASLGRTFANYRVVFENVSDYEICINDLYVEEYPQARPFYSINEEKTKGGELPSDTISPNDEIVLGLDFSNYVNMDVDVYYVSPILIYTIGDNQQKRVLPYYVSGYNLANDEINFIGDKLL